MSGWRAAPADPEGYVTCVCGKRAYPHRRVARRIRRRMASRGLHVYRCLITGQWHVGHMRPGTTRHDYRPTPEPEDTP